MELPFSFREIRVAICSGFVMFVLNVAVLSVSAFDTESAQRDPAAKCLASTDKYDLDRLGRFVWNVSQQVGSDVFEYRISLCSTLRSPAGCVGSSICRLSRGRHNADDLDEDGEAIAVSFGTLEAPAEVDKDEDDVGFWLKFRGATCPGGGRYRAFVNLQCGTGLGSPLLLGFYDECRSYFVWETSVACDNVTAERPSPTALRNEVPCYAYDSLGNRYDLSGLTRTNGGIYVPRPPGVAGESRFYINVCSTMDSGVDDGTSSCPTNCAACRVVGSKSECMGHLDGGVRLTDDGKLWLEYVTPVSGADGVRKVATTTITFSCPSDGRDRKPVFVSNENDDIHRIEWATAAACPWKTLQSSDACRLSSDIDGISEDISSLRVINGVPQHAEGKIDGKNYDLYLSVCGGFPAGFSCGDPSDPLVANARVCRKSVDDPRGVVLGGSLNQSLRFVDGRLYLSYHGGSPCFDTGSSRPRAVHVHLKCGSTTTAASRGSLLRFVQEEECVTFFEWETILACVQRLVGSACYASDGRGHIVDLSLLTRGHGEEPWLAIGAGAMPLIYMNVCGPVGRSYNTTARCPVGTSVCVAGDDGRMEDFGRYVSRPTVDRDTGDVQLSYVGLDRCRANPQKFMSSMVTFVCHPGEMSGGPRLVSKSMDGCSMEFEWPTAAACVQSYVSGHDCKVEVVQLGFTFDLSPLRKIDGGHYTVTAGDYDFLLNVCGAVGESSSCPGRTGEVGICRVKHTDKGVSENLGLPADVLVYDNGRISMTYKQDVAGDRLAVIAFVCDRDAGVGWPQFINSTREAYNFQWRSSHVCLPPLIECVFVNDARGEMYDLSSLSRSSSMGDWLVLDSTFKALHRKYYLNVCRRLTRAGDLSRSACDEGAAVCATKIDDDRQETPLIANLGRAESAPHFENGQLVVRYTTGEPCRDMSGSTLNYSSVVYFHCVNETLPDEEVMGPIFLRNRSCEYVFLWSTPVACPLRIDYAGSGCAVTDSRTGYTFDLKSLDNEFVVPSTGFDVFKDFHMNLCGIINSSACGTEEHLDEREPVAACGRLKDGHASVVVATSTSRRVYVTDVATVKMEFDGPLNETYGKPDYRMEVVLLCHRQFYSPWPRLVRHDDDLLVFEYLSPLTCPPQAVDCVFNDRRGNTYDLSELARLGHYEATDLRPTDSGFLYHLAVCRPLLIPPFSNCPEGMNIGACVSDPKSGIAYSLGYVQGRPTAGLVDGATVSLTYHSGSPCKNGTARMSARIDFKCASQQSEPSFLGESESCEYVFSWETPLACPVEQKIGADCKVTDDRYSIRFDLAKLSRPEGYIVEMAEGGKKFTVNACGPLSMDCGGHKDVGVCVDDGTGSKFSGGSFSDKLVYDQGEITLRYDDDTTGGGTSSMIRFVCDHSTTGQVEGPAYSSAASSDTALLFVWKTSYACRRSFRESTCKLYRPEDDALYDLGRLTLLDGNHEVIVANGTYKYLINVCRSVVHGKGAMCHYGAAVCGVNLTEANLEYRYSNIGDVGDVGPTFEKGVLSLRYDMGEMCRTAGTFGSHKVATIRFSCDPDAGAGKPYLLADDGCQYLFGWSSAYACPVKVDRSFGPTPLGYCTAVNPDNGYKFDLASLRQSSYDVVVSNATTLTIGICEPPVNGTPCGLGVGSCLHSDVKMAASAGTANSNLRYVAGMLVLNYTDGTPCSRSSVPNATANTVITFTCASSGTGIGSPRFVEHSECSYFVSWLTELACESHVHCAVELDNEVLDLSPLMKTEGHHFAIGGFSDNDDAVYILNVCRALGSLAGPQCPARSAACRYDSKTGLSMSLGAVGKPPFVSDTGHVVLEYTNGSPCPYNRSLNASTTILFQCDESVFHDVVRLIDVTSNCTFVFEWPTEVVCPVVTHGRVGADCSYYDTRTKESFDLARLTDASPEGYRVQHDVGSGVFTINYCLNRAASGRYGPCATAAVCLQEGGVETSWGSANSALYDYDGEHLRVSYKGDEPCPDAAFRNKSSIIWFSCDEHAGPGTPDLAKTFDCQAIFYWRTSLMCRGRAAMTDCTVWHGGRLYDLRLLSSYSQSWVVDDPASPDEMFWLNVCGQLVGKRDPRCPAGSTVCWKSLEDRVSSIGSAASQTLIVSDEEQTLFLRYSVPENVCGRDDPSTNVAAASSSLIEFTCNSKASVPRLISRGEKANNCTFTFRWETPIACSETNSIELLEKDGLIVNNNFDLKLDLSPLFNSYGVTYEHRGDDDYDYHVSLFGLDHVAGHEKCRGAAICQTKRGNSDFERVIGRVVGRKFYLQGPELVVKLQSDSVCGRSPKKNVSSVITMRCSPSSEQGTPVFVYESIDCNYMFDWDSDAVCALEAFQRGLDDNIQVTRGTSGRGMVTFLAVALAVSLALLALLVFGHRQKLLSVLSKWCPAKCSSLGPQSRHGSVSFARLADDTESANIVC